MTNEVNAGTQQQAGQTAAPVQQAAAPVQQQAASTPKIDPNRTFTRDEVTKIVKTRLDRFSNGFYKKLGFEKAEDFDKVWEARKNYDDVIKERDGLKTTNGEMTEKLAFLANNIDPDRYDDVKTFFKGKGTAFDEAILKEQLGTHPEWVKKAAVAPTKPTTTVTKIGTTKKGPDSKTEEEVAQEMYGMSFK